MDEEIKDRLKEAGVESLKKKMETHPPEIQKMLDEQITDVRDELPQQGTKLKQSVEKSVKQQHDKTDGTLLTQISKSERTIASCTNDQRKIVESKLSQDTTQLKKAIETSSKTLRAEKEENLPQKALRLEQITKMRANIRQEEAEQIYQQTRLEPVIEALALAHEREIKLLQHATISESCINTSGNKKIEMKRKRTDQLTPFTMLDKRDQEKLQTVDDNLANKKIKLLEAVDEEMHKMEQDMDQETAILKSEGTVIHNLEEKVEYQSAATAFKRMRIEKLQSNRDDQVSQIESKGKMIKQMEAKLSEQNEKLSQIAQKGKNITGLETYLSEQNEKISQIVSKGKKIKQLEMELFEQNEKLLQIASKGTKLKQLEIQLSEQSDKLSLIASKGERIKQLEMELFEQHTTLSERNVKELETELSKNNETLSQITSKGKKIKRLKTELSEQNGKLLQMTSKGKKIKQLETELSEQNERLSKTASKVKRIKQLEMELSEQGQYLYQMSPKGIKKQKLKLSEQNEKVSQMRKEITQMEIKLCAKTETLSQMTSDRKGGKQHDKEVYDKDIEKELKQLESEFNEQNEKLSRMAKDIKLLEAELSDQNKDLPHMTLKEKRNKQWGNEMSEQNENFSQFQRQIRQHRTELHEENEKLSQVASKGKINKLENEFSERNEKISQITSKGKKIRQLETEVFERNVKLTRMASKGKKIKKLENKLYAQNVKVNSVEKEVENLECGLTEQSEKMSKILEMKQKQLKQNTEKEKSELHEASKAMKVIHSKRTTSKQMKGDRYTGISPTSAKTSEIFLQSKIDVPCVKTQLICQAEQKLKDNGCVVISGRPGEGKTIAGANLLTSAFGKETCVFLSYARDWHNVDISETNGVFIDDMFGVSQLEQRKLEEWLKVLPEIQKLVDDGKIKLIVTTRASIFLECRTQVNGFSIFKQVVEFSSSKLLREEKVDMLTLTLNRHGKKMHSWVVRKCVDSFTSPIGFPLCCHLFCTDETLYKFGASFFSKPFKFFKDNLGKIDKLKYISLVYMFCRQGEVPISDFTDQSNSSEFVSIMNTIIHAIDKVQDGTILTKTQVKCSLEDMNGVYIETTHSSFMFMHSIIYETVGLLYGCMDPDTTIKVCLSDFLHRCTLSNNTLNSPEQWFVPAQSYPVLAERFIDEVIEEEEVQRTAGHIAFQNVHFVSVFRKVLEENEETDFFFQTRQEDLFHTDLCFLSELARMTPNRIIGSLKEILDIITSCTHQFESDRWNCWRCFQLDEAALNSCRYFKLHHFLLLLNYGAIISTEKVESMFKVFSDHEFKEAIEVVQQYTPLDFSLLQSILEKAYKYNRLELVKSMIAQGAEVTPKFVNVAAVGKNFELLQMTIQKLKLESRWDPANHEIKEALITSFRSDNRAMIQVFFDEGVKANIECVYYAAVNGNSTNTEAAIENCDVDIGTLGGVYATAAMEASCATSNEELILLLESYGIHVTPRCLYLAVVAGNIMIVKIVLGRLKSARVLNAEDKHTIEAVEHSFKANNVEMTNLLLSAGTTITPNCVYMAAASGNLRLWKLAVKHCIHLEGNMDNLIKETTNVIFTLNDKEMIKVLMMEDSLVCHRCIYWAVKNNDMHLMHKIFHILKAHGRWIVDNDDTRTAISEAFKENNKEMIEFLLTNGILVTPECVHLSVSHGEVALLKTSIQNLKTAGRWKEDAPEVQKSLVDCFELNDKEMIHVLMIEGVPLNPQCVIFAVVNNETTLLASAIKKLKIRKLWQPHDDIYRFVIVEAFKEINIGVIDVLVSEGVGVIPACLPLAVLSKKKCLLLKTIQNMKSRGLWKIDDEYAQDALIKAHSEDLKEMTATLLSEGVQDIPLTDVSSVATELFSWSVVANNLKVMEIAIGSLKQATKWSIENLSIRNSIIKAYMNKNKEIVEHLNNDKSLFTPASVEWAVLNNDTTVAKLAILSLQSRKLWQEDSGLCATLEKAIEQAYERNHQKIINILQTEGVPVTHRCVYWAVCNQEPTSIQTTVQALKASKQWDPSKRVVVMAIEKAYEINNNVIYNLLTDDIHVTHRCVYWAVLNKEPKTVFQSIQIMKKLRQWNADNEDMVEAMEKAYENKNEEIINILLNERVQVTHKCVYWAVLKRESAIVQRAIKTMKSFGMWNPGNEDVIEAIEKAYEIKDKNIIYILLTEGIQITHKCVFLAVLTKQPAIIETTIRALVSTKQWDPSNENLALAIEKAYEINHKEIINILLTERVQVTHMCVYWAVCNKDSSTVQTAVSALKLSGHWNPGDRNVNWAIDKAYEINHKEILNILLSEGVSVTQTRREEIEGKLTENAVRFKFSVGTSDETELESALMKISQETPMLEQSIEKSAQIQQKEIGNVFQQATSLKQKTVRVQKQTEDLEETLFRQVMDSDSLIKECAENQKEGMNSGFSKRSTSTKMFNTGGKEEFWTTEPLCTLWTRYLQASLNQIQITNMWKFKTQIRENFTEETKSICQECRPGLLDGIYQTDSIQQPSMKQEGDSIQKASLQGQFEKANKLLLQLCNEIKAKEGANCFEVFPAYRKGCRTKPFIVVLEEAFGTLRHEQYKGIPVVRRRYDMVSAEAGLVMNGDQVRQNLFPFNDMNRLADTLTKVDLMQKHSNITFISACPFRSRNDGADLERQTCIVIHCLLKEYIPFMEEPFPSEIDGIPVDVREGYFQLGMMDFDDEEMSSINRVGNRANDYNKPLLIGTGIGPDSGPKGTLGGFVELQDGTIGFVTCAHVVKDAHQILQPSVGDGGDASCICGTVQNHIFEPGKEGDVSIDAAVVKIIDLSRIPKSAAFIDVDKQDYEEAGFGRWNPPNFARGKTVSFRDLTNNERQMCVLKWGRKTDLTRGVLALKGAQAKPLKMHLQGADGVPVLFHNQLEVLSLQGRSFFFDLGDSGSLVFLNKDSKELYCIGMCIGRTQYGSCVVTPIENILGRLGARFVDFTRFQGST